VKQPPPDDWRTRRLGEPFQPRWKARDLKERFARLHAFVTERQGWIVSVPGAEMVTIEVLPGSILPNELRDAGYALEAVGSGERILASAITEKLTLTSCGVFEPLTPDSTKAVAEIRRHEGIVKVRRFTFTMT